VAKEGTNAVVDRLLTVLNDASGYLATELDAQDADYGDGITLADIPDRDQHYGDSIELPPPQNFPCLYILPRGWTEFELLFGKKDVIHMIDVQVYAAHTNHQTLTKMLWRYARAVEFVLEKYTIDGVTLYDMEWAGVSYSPSAPWRETGMMIQGVQLNGRFKERVERPFSV